MFLLKLTPSQCLSHQFAVQLALQENLRFRLNGDNQFLSNLAISGGMETPLTENPPMAEPSGTLTIFAEGLNLEKIAQVMADLSAILEWGDSQFLDNKQSVNLLAVKSQVSLKSSVDIPAAIEEVAVKHQVELAYLSSAPTLSQPGLLLMDMDSTVIDVECIDEIAKLAGVGEQVSAVTELAMQGKLDFAQSLENRVACLTDTPETVLQTVRDALPLMPGITNLVTELKTRGWKVAIASGGFTFFADYLKERLALDAAVANVLEIENGKLTGKVSGDIVDANVKASTLVALAEQWNIPKSQTIALGDGANDLVMMAEAGLGVAYHAKPIVRQQADVGIRFSATDTLLLLLS